MMDDALIWNDDHTKFFEQLATDAGYPCFRIEWISDEEYRPVLDRYAVTKGQAERWLRAIEDAGNE